MKDIKLLTLTTINYLVIFSGLTLIALLFFLYNIQKKLADGMDETLAHKKEHILKAIKKNSNQIPANIPNWADFSLIPAVAQKTGVNHYADTLIQLEGDDEEEPFRKLSTVVQLKNKFYRLDIIMGEVEKDEISSSLTNTLSLTFFLMVSIFFLASHFFSKRLWRPFYHTLEQLNGFEIDRITSLYLKPSRIKEFNTLNHSISDLTIRAVQAFNNQKQFIENASHELQTPLAINQNKLEQLTDDPNLTGTQSEIIQSLISSTQRMIRLNKTLILLSKIENEQFLVSEKVFVEDIVSDTLSLFDDQRELSSISVTTDIEPNTFITSNRTLADLLISNLIKNAFVHNFPGGTIHLSFKKHQLTIANTSNRKKIPEEKLFQRFYKNTHRQESWGLGLAIVNKICTLSKWTITYTEKDNIHSFSVLFR